jgi:hypothetical protein
MIFGQIKTSLAGKAAITISDNAITHYLFQVGYNTFLVVTGKSSGKIFLVGYR